MADAIGAAAGKVWQYLDQNGAATATQISRGIKENTAVTNQAIGWLAREHKLSMDRAKRTVKYSLR